ncbi:HIT zinc finger protein (macronuclear) [Tetrahymena thermophila SB210]|uniref:HIT zinc finger protein n=1 Tax=Tetrahymena thermophila (strain SB210) TaxID=312017 RepID=Q23DW2_TETTS|nr:HIT zinc finger protein [Tetrahymena thermophila SB210]EAR94556.2 HIT zinc finger protein [Tetrahymena thermophila SB210]|eukprot:XP_001014574.2 HIT zinc finger protein [Tetrahymena thermophila SB210]
MDNLREEDKRTLELLFLKAKQLDEELDHEADIEDYRQMQAFFNEDEEQSKKIIQIKQQIQGIEAEEDLTKEQLEEQNQIIEEIQRELSQDELFTPDNQQQVSEEQKEQQKKCFVCKTKEHKYTCPGCFKKTCSLQCSKDHKVQFNCSGRPNYTGYVDKNSYTEATAKKDYQYLKQTLEGTEYIRKKLSFVNHNPELLRLKLLKIYARKKHKIDLVFAPTIMKRHRENISFYYMKNKLIYWLLEVQIVYFQKQGQGEQNENNILIADQQGEIENVKLQEKLIRKLVDPIPENIFWSHVLKSGETNLFDDDLLLKENVDFSNAGVLKQLENKELSIFIKNRYRIIDIVETKTKDNLNLQWSFKVPQSYLDIQIPNEYRERENINKQFQSEYQMIEIHPDTFIYNTLHGAKINEFPEIFLVNKKYLQAFTEKYKCLLQTSE